jgi:hypothetical protein
MYVSFAVFTPEYLYILSLHLTSRPDKKIVVKFEQETLRVLCGNSIHRSMHTCSNTARRISLIVSESRIEICLQTVR